MRLFLSAFAAAGLCALAGCGSSTVGTANTYVDVVGTVTLPDGQPLKRGMIYFEPEVPDKGRDDQAVVTDGKFTSKLAVAKYKVAFDTQGGTSTVPAKYRKFGPDLTVDIKGGDVTIAMK